MGRNDRPENSAPPEIFYNEDEARKYTDNSRMVAIQTALTERALELLALPDDGTPKLLLDLGCGSGLSGEALTERGHVWVVSGAQRGVRWAGVGGEVRRGRRVSRLLLPCLLPTCALPPLRHGRAWTSARRCWMWLRSGRWRETCAYMTWGTACPSAPALSTAPSLSQPCSGCATRCAGGGGRGGARRGAEGCGTHRPGPSRQGAALGAPHGGASPPRPPAARLSAAGHEPQRAQAAAAPLLRDAVRVSGQGRARGAAGAPAARRRREGGIMCMLLQR